MNHFSIGSIFRRSFSILGKNLISFLALGCVMSLPAFYFTHQLVEGLAAGTYDDGGILAKLISTLSTQMLAATLIYGSVMELRGMHVTTGKCVQVGLTRALPVLATIIVAGLAIAVGFLLLIVPGIILSIAFYVVLPVAVIERPGVMNSLSRSRELTRGYKGKIFGLVLLTGGFSSLVNVLLQRKVQSLAMAGDIDSLGSYFYASTAFSMLVAILGAIFASVVYHDLRAIKDGVNIDELAAVFE